MTTIEAQLIERLRTLPQARFVARNHLDTAIIAFRNVPARVNITCAQAFTPFPSRTLAAPVR